jgi:hypothetical protein
VKKKELEMELCEPCAFFVNLVVKFLPQGTQGFSQGTQEGKTKKKEL